MLVGSGVDTYRDNDHQCDLGSNGGGRQRPRVSILRENISDIGHLMLEGISSPLHSSEGWNM